MKKLMVAAAAAAMTAGAFADVCADVDYSVTGAKCMVYDVSLKLKTLGPKKAKCVEKDACGDKTCADDVYYLDNTTRTIVGYMWLCDDLCWDVDDDVRIVLWDKKAKSAIIPLPYAVEGTKVVQYPNTFNFDFLGRYGKKANKVAAAWAVDADLVSLSCAGLNGSTIKDKEMGTVSLKSISGNAVGMTTLSTIEVAKKCQDPQEFTAKIAGLCDCWETWCSDGDDADEVPVSGTWSIKYNKKISNAGKSMLLIVPAYAKELEV